MELVSCLITAFNGFEKLPHCFHSGSSIWHSPQKYTTVLVSLHLTLFPFSHSHSIIMNSSLVHVSSSLMGKFGWFVLSYLFCFVFVLSILEATTKQFSVSHHFIETVVYNRTLMTSVLVSCHHDKMPEKVSLLKKRFVWAHSFRIFAWWLRGSDPWAGVLQHLPVCLSWRSHLQQRAFGDHSKP